MGRKVVKNGGVFVAAYLTEIRDFANTLSADLDFIKQATLTSVDKLEQVTKLVIENAQGNPNEINAASVDYLHAFGLVSYAYMFAKISAAASQKSGEFYAGKLNLAKYFVTRMLPELDSRIAKIQAGGELLMQFSPEYFTTYA